VILIHPEPCWPDKWFSVCQTSASEALHVLACEINISRRHNISQAPPRSPDPPTRPCPTPPAWKTSWVAAANQRETFPPFSRGALVIFNTVWILMRLLTAVHSWQWCAPNGQLICAESLGSRVANSIRSSSWAGIGIGMGIGCPLPRSCNFGEPGLCCNTFFPRSHRAITSRVFPARWRGEGVNNFQMPAQDMHYIIIMPPVRSIRLLENLCIFEVLIM